MTTVSTEHATRPERWELVIGWITIGDSPLKLRGRAPTWIYPSFSLALVVLTNAVLKHLATPTLATMIGIHVACMIGAGFARLAFADRMNRLSTRIVPLLVGSAGLVVGQLDFTVAFGPQGTTGAHSWVVPTVTMTGVLLFACTREVLVFWTTRRLARGDDCPLDAGNGSQGARAG